MLEAPSQRQPLRKSLAAVDLGGLGVGRGEVPQPASRGLHPPPLPDMPASGIVGPQHCHFRPHTFQTCWWEGSVAFPNTILQQTGTGVE